MLRQIILAVGGGAFVLSLGACATLSPRKRIENRFVEFGLSPEKADCMGDELDERLDRSDLTAVADFIGNVNEAGSPGEGLDALLSIDNPRAAAAIARAGLACAFSG